MWPNPKSTVPTKPSKVPDHLANTKNWPDALDASIFNPKTLKMIEREKKTAGWPMSHFFWPGMKLSAPHAEGRSGPRCGTDGSVLNRAIAGSFRPGGCARGTHRGREQPWFQKAAAHSCVRKRRPESAETSARPSGRAKRQLRAKSCRANRGRKWLPAKLQRGLQNAERARHRLSILLFWGISSAGS